MTTQSNRLHVSFPGGKRVDAVIGSQTIRTDQSVAHGGEGSAAEPFDLFLASLATCAGLYVIDLLSNPRYSDRATLARARPSSRKRETAKNSTQRCRSRRLPNEIPGRGARRRSQLPGQEDARESSRRRDRRRCRISKPSVARLADLANLVNEAALSATRRGANTIDAPGFRAAYDKIVLGDPREAKRDPSAKAG